jgi:2,4-dienoyl-CoA reductase-like NADH-dependent reductase (Old Yellow Enzyme family)
MQLAHIGMNTLSKSEIIYAPSSLPIPNQNRKSKEMTKDDIIRIENNFANAALRAKKANFDGIEIHSAQGGLLSQFLTPFFNRRKDEYGGSIENRARLLREIIKKVKEKCGKDFPILVKINGGDEMGKDGMTVDEFIEVGKMLEKDGGITAIEISGNNFMLKKPEEKAYYRDAAVRLADTVKIPVILTGGIRDKETIDDIYKNTNVQFFGICRPFMKDPNFLEKLK